jgi:hypothetical protein
MFIAECILYYFDVVHSLVFLDISSIFLCHTEQCRAGGIFGHSAVILSILWWGVEGYKILCVSGHLGYAVTLELKKNSWNVSHNAPPARYKSKVICCWHMCASFTSCLSTLGLFIRQVFVVIRSRHIIMYCNKIFICTTVTSLSFS